MEVSDAQGQSISAKMVQIRRQVCPKTSYATSGSASYLLKVMSPEASLQALFNERMQPHLFQSKEFDKVEHGRSADICNPLFMASLQGHVIVLFLGNVLLSSSEEEATRKQAVHILKENKSKLIFIICKNTTSKSLQLNLAALAPITIHQNDCGGDIHLLSCFVNSTNLAALYAPRSKTSSTKLAFNGQQSVLSRQQFRYLWSTKKDVTSDGKRRVLQRLSDRKCVARPGQSSYQMNMEEWDQIISNCLRGGMDDFGIYSIIRCKTLGSTLEKDLEIDLDATLHAATAAEGSKNKAVAATSEEDSENGRALHMVKMLVSCIPDSLKTPSHTQV